MQQKLFLSCDGEQDVIITVLTKDDNLEFLFGIQDMVSLFVGSHSSYDPNENLMTVHCYSYDEWREIVRWITKNYGVQTI